MNTKENPSYYAIIPADVRYANIPANAKLLYGEITALCHKEGFCWATNAYFAELYKVSKFTISDWVKVLKDNGFIRYEIADKTSRKIYLTIALPLAEISKGVGQKEQGGDRQKEQHSNTRVSNTINKTFEGFWEKYPRKVSKKKALVAWIRIKPDETTVTKILTALEAYKKTPQWTKDNGAFIPHPTTWLNGERWNDELGIALEKQEVRIARPATKEEAAQPIEKRELAPEAQKAIADARAKLGKKFSMP